MVHLIINLLVKSDEQSTSHGELTFNKEKKRQRRNIHFDWQIGCSNKRLKEEWNIFTQIQRFRIGQLSTCCSHLH